MGRRAGPLVRRVDFAFVSAQMIYTDIALDFTST